MTDRATAPSYLVAGCRPWNRATFERLSSLDGEWRFASDPAELDAALEASTPRAIFFLHWSWIVAPEVHEAIECVVFHMTDVPYGRGGSPLQNLIVRGHETTTLSALRMTADVDAGPVYAKVPVALHGSAEAIYLRVDAAAGSLIEAMVQDWPEAVDQVGDAVSFARRTPDQSAVPKDLADLDAWHDFVRMLDAEGYPAAHIDHGAFRISLRRAVRYDGRVEVDARIEPREEPA